MSTRHLLLIIPFLSSLVFAADSVHQRLGPGLLFALIIAARGDAATWHWYGPGSVGIPPFGHLN